MAEVQQAPAAAAAPGPIVIDTQHDDMVHDSQLDYYGTKLATASSGAFLFVWQCVYCVRVCAGLCWAVWSDRILGISNACMQSKSRYLWHIHLVWCWLNRLRSLRLVLVSA